MTLAAAPSALYLGTLPVTPNNRNQLKTWMDDVVTEVNAIGAGTGISAPITLGSDVAVGGFGQRMLLMNNIDGAAADGDGTREDFTLHQRWDTSTGPDTNGRHNVQLGLGYNVNLSTGGRNTLTEPSMQWCMETHVQGLTAAEAYTEAGLIFWGTDGSQNRPFYVTADAVTAVADIGFKCRNYNFTSGWHDATEDDIILHLTATVVGGARVGVGLEANANVQFHVYGRQLWESRTGTVNNKFWDIDYGAGDSFIFRAVNDAFSAGGTIFTVTRSGATPTRFAFGAIKVSATLTDYANNAAAVSGGLAVGDLYQTSGTVKVVTA